MMTSIDGKIEGDFIHDHNEELGDWFELQKLEDTDAWGNGNNTHEKYFSDTSIDLSPYAEAESPTEDHVLLKPSPYIVSFDTKGKVLWNADSLEFPEASVLNMSLICGRCGYPLFWQEIRPSICLRHSTNSIRFSVSGASPLSAERPSMPGSFRRIWWMRYVLWSHRLSTAARN